GGCCLDDGGCFQATPGADGAVPTDIPCGSNGERGATCPAGDQCSHGGCQRDLGVDCTSANCAGCCYVENLASHGGIVTSPNCFEGSQDNFCGSHGDMCLRCTPST